MILFGGFEMLVLSKNIDLYQPWHQRMLQPTREVLSSRSVLCEAGKMPSPAENFAFGTYSLGRLCVHLFASTNGNNIFVSPAFLNWFFQPARLVFNVERRIR